MISTGAGSLIGLMRQPAVLRTGVGVVLLTAAATKGYELATGPVLDGGFWSSRWLLSCVVEFELGLGLWLVSGLYAGLSMFIAFITFICFLEFNLYQALTGVRLCHCLGRARIPSW